MDLHGPGVPPPHTAPAPRPWAATWTPPDRAGHRAAVLACQDAIRAGDVYQVNVCTRFDGALTGDPLDLFADIAATTRPGKAAYLEGDWGAVASFSPRPSSPSATASWSSGPSRARCR